MRVARMKGSNSRVPERYNALASRDNLKRHLDRPPALIDIISGRATGDGHPAASTPPVR
jgi:hypothetical protein